MMDFFREKWPTTECFSAFSLLKKAGRDRDGHDVVEGVSSGGDSEPPNGKENREVDSCNRPKNKHCRVERIRLVWPAAEEVNVVMRAEKRR